MAKLCRNVFADRTLQQKNYATGMEWKTVKDVKSKIMLKFAYKKRFKAFLSIQRVLVDEYHSNVLFDLIQCMGLYNFRSWWVAVMFSCVSFRLL